VHTDIISHSVDAFPVRTTEEFVEFLHAIHASGPGALKPTPVEVFVSTRPAALAFVQTPVPIPASFAKESFYSVSAYKFTNAEGVSKFGRYRVVPQEGNAYLDPPDAAQQTPDFLFDELKSRLANRSVKMRVWYKSLPTAMPSTIAPSSGLPIAPSSTSAPLNLPPKFRKTPPLNAASSSIPSPACRASTRPATRCSTPAPTSTCSVAAAVAPPRHRAALASSDPLRSAFTKRVSGQHCWAAHK
jgi:catalase